MVLDLHSLHFGNAATRSLTVQVIHDNFLPLCLVLGKLQSSLGCFWDILIIRSLEISGWFRILQSTFQFVVWSSWTFDWLLTFAWYAIFVFRVKTTVKGNCIWSGNLTHSKYIAWILIQYFTHLCFQLLLILYCWVILITWASRRKFERLKLLDFLIRFIFWLLFSSNPCLNPNNLLQTIVWLFQT